MKAAATFVDVWTKDGVSLWENEGGSLASTERPSGQSPVGENEGALWPPASVIDPPASEGRRADRGVADTHTLSIMRVSLLLLVPVLGALAVFWASIATLAP
jgi:hypothetical protein